MSKLFTTELLKTKDEVTVYYHCLSILKDTPLATKTVNALDVAADVLAQDTSYTIFEAADPAISITPRPRR